VGQFLPACPRSGPARLVGLPLTTAGGVGASKNSPATVAKVHHK